MNIKSLVWSEEFSPCSAVSYDHCISVTPFGRFLITWKSWKDYPGYELEETPWDVWGGCYDSLQEAKDAAEELWEKKLMACMA